MAKVPIPTVAITSTFAPILLIFSPYAKLHFPSHPLCRMIMPFNVMKRRIIQSLSGNGTALSGVVFFSLRLQGFLSG
jgi:hypothetical protein